MEVFDILNDFKSVGKNFNKDDSVYWVLSYVDELENISEKFNLEHENVEECKGFNKSSKITLFKNYMYIVINVLDYYSDAVHSRELYVFLGENHIITSSKEDLELINDLIKDIPSYTNCFMLKDKPSPAMLFYYILDRIIVKNYNVISQVEAYVDEIEINILKNIQSEQLDELINLRRQVYKIRKYLNPLRYIGDSLVSNDNAIINRDSIGNYVILNKKIDKLMISLDNLVQDLALVREAFEAEISNKTNELMKIFTLIATIFLPLNLITSIYGMNLKGIPFTSLEHGYYYILAVMLSISLWLVWIFKKNKWL